jgi:hypothetical protein
VLEHTPVIRQRLAGVGEAGGGRGGRGCLGLMVQLDSRARSMFLAAGLASAPFLYCLGRSGEPGERRQRADCASSIPGLAVALAAGLASAGLPRWQGEVCTGCRRRRGADGVASVPGLAVALAAGPASAGLSCWQW